MKPLVGGPPFDPQRQLHGIGTQLDSALTLDLLILLLPVVVAHKPEKRGGALLFDHPDQYQGYCFPRPGVPKWPPLLFVSS